MTKEKISDAFGRLDAISEDAKRKVGRERKFSDESIGKKTHSVINNMISNILDDDGVDNIADPRRGETASNSIFSDNFLKDEKY